MSLLQTPPDPAVARVLVLAVGIAVAPTPFFSGLLSAAIAYLFELLRFSREQHGEADKPVVVADARAV